MRAAPFSGTGWLRTAAFVSSALLLACGVHALLSGPGAPWDPLSGVAGLARTYALGSPALANPEDLRHPGRARPEMPLMGQPALVDPRPAALLIRPPSTPAMLP